MVEIDSIKIRLSSRKNPITLDIAEARELYRQLARLFGEENRRSDLPSDGFIVSGSRCDVEVGGGGIA